MSEEIIKIFYSYSRKDLDMRNTLEDHLAALREANKITTWHDLELEAGTEWEPAILQKLNTADIILLLVSHNFIASKYCYGTELKRAIARHQEGTARVIPIILRPCDWNYSDVPFSRLNVLPTHAKAITSWGDPDEAFTTVAQQIRETVDQLRDKKQAERQAEEQQKQQLLAQKEAEEKVEQERNQQKLRHAEQLPSQVVEVVQSSDRTQKARTAIDRIELKMDKRSVSVPVTPPIVNRQLTRQQFLKWAIPAGVGVVGVTIASQFSGKQTRQLSSAKRSTVNPNSPASPSLSPITPSTSTPEPTLSSTNANLPLTTIDYSRLEEFLKAERWREANSETAGLIRKAANQVHEDYLDKDSIKNFPCEVLSEIDRLWVANSNGKFGFSIQKKIYTSGCGGKTDGQWYEEAMNCFGSAVGYGITPNDWVGYDSVIFDTSAPRGHLPLESGFLNYDGGDYGLFFSRVQTCNL